MFVRPTVEKLSNLLYFVYLGFIHMQIVRFLEMVWGCWHLKEDADIDMEAVF